MHAEIIWGENGQKNVNQTSDDTHQVLGIVKSLGPYIHKSIFAHLTVPQEEVGIKNPWLHGDTTPESKKIAKYTIPKKNNLVDYF